VDACRGLSGARFVSLPSQPDTFLLLVDPIVHVDVLRCRPHLDGWCSNCSRWTRIHGSVAWFEDEDDLPFGFSRSDLEYFGHSPMILVDPGTAKRLNSARLRGVSCWPVREPPDEPMDPFYGRMNQLNSAANGKGFHVVNDQGERGWEYAQHVRAPGADPDLIPAATGKLHAAFMAITNGATLFDRVGEDGSPTRRGMRIFNVEEIARHTAFLHGTLRTNAERHPEEFEELARVSPIDLLAWYESLVAVAATNGSADLFVIDPSVMDINDEPEVIVLDHGYFYGGPINDGAVVGRWNNFAEFFDAVICNANDFT
jgi:hypothetical protein